MPKRPFPFHSSSPLQMKTHVNNIHVHKESYLRKVYETTTDLLMKGAAKFYGNQLDQDCLKAQESALKCQSCGRSNCHDSCVFCGKKICSVCSRTCDSCRGNFCGMCSVVNYDERDERIFCLGC